MSVKSRVLSSITAAIVVLSAGCEEPTRNWYADNDTDSYGDPDVVIQASGQPSGYVLDASDCNDSDDTINPGIKNIVPINFGLC